MQATPNTTELVALLRNADEQAIRRRLDELEEEEAALKTVLRSVMARNRVRPPVRRDAALEAR